MPKKPLHARIADEMRGRIQDRELTPGDLLPSESSLQQQFAVSRSVVRQALATLESEGLVRRAHGRGTIVSPQTELHRDVELSSGLSSQLQGLGSHTSTHVVSYLLGAPPEHLADLGPEVLALERLRSVDGCPVAFIRTWIPARLSTHLPPEDLEDASLHQLIRERAGLRVSGGQRHIRAVAAAAPLDGYLEVATATPLLLLDGVSLDQDGQTIEVFSTWHRSDLIAFDVSLRATESASDTSGLASRLDRALAELTSIREQL